MRLSIQMLFNWQVSDSVVDPDRDGSASFCRIRIWIGIQGMPIRFRPHPDRYGINSKPMKKFVKSTFFQKILICGPKYWKHLRLMRKIKHCEVTMLWLKVKNIQIFNICRTWGRTAGGSPLFGCLSGYGFGSASTWKFGSGSALIIKQQ